jgi:hypothetical protein
MLLRKFKSLIEQDKKLRLKRKRLRKIKSWQRLLRKFKSLIEQDKKLRF